MAIKVLEINTVCQGGSVGRITVDICRTLERNGDDCLIAYGRRGAPEGVPAFRFGTNISMGLHVLSTFLKGEHGFASERQTRKLIEKIKEYDPDVIQLHNVHGFVLQVELLFAYLKKAGKPVVWTLHDCWPYTGHCAFYDYNGCSCWKDGCMSCHEYRKTYPYALFRNNAARNFARKRAAFTAVPDLTIVMPSAWLADQVLDSFLRDYPVEVIPNGIDRSVFQPRESDLRRQLGLEGKFVVLGVANVWERRKGLVYFQKLAESLPDDFRIVLIGLDKKQRHSLPANVIGLGKTENAAELATYYTMADVFVNATLEDNFPTTNLEALACGTPVITFDTGGSPESLDESCGRVAPKGDLTALREALLAEKEAPHGKEACLRRAELYGKNERFQEYVTLYHELADRLPVRR
ncbi:MAG: glycosyltransferase [Lachnospiraceae bacterium]|nr:glycosyltransferase [Lachnospiraceae bacterium]